VEIDSGARELMLGRFQRRSCRCEPPGRQRQLPGRKPQRIALRHCRPQAHPLEAHIGIAGILDPFSARRCECRLEPALWDRQQWAPKQDRSLLDGMVESQPDPRLRLTHPRQPIHPAAAGKPHQHGFSLIVEMVCKQNLTRLRQRFTAEMLADQGIASRPGRLLNSRTWLRAGPSQNDVREAEAPSLVADPRRLLCRFRPQAVIDGDDENGSDAGRQLFGRLASLAIGSIDPPCDKVHQRNAVGAAGDRNGDGQAHVAQQTITLFGADRLVGRRHGA